MITVIITVITSIRPLRCVEGAADAGGGGERLETSLAKRRQHARLSIYYKGNKQALQTFFFEIFCKLLENGEKRRVERGGRRGSRSVGKSLAILGRKTVLTILTVERVTSVKFATNRELSGRGASKLIDAEILSGIII